MAAKARAGHSGGERSGQGLEGFAPAELGRHGKGILRALNRAAVGGVWLTDTECMGYRTASPAAS